MRCLGRLVLLIVVVIAIAVGWIFRDELSRWVHARLHPTQAAARTGRPSPEALRQARSALDGLRRGARDSVRLTPDQMASLLAHGSDFLPGASFDSLSVELESGAVRLRTVIDSAVIPSAIRSLIPGDRAYQVVVARGPLNPVRQGVAELRVEHLTIHDVPLPTSLVARSVQQWTGQPVSGLIDFTLPPVVGGFRIEPGSAMIYRVHAP